MSRIIKSSILAFFAVVALGAVAAAAMATPEFKGNKPDVHFIGHSLLTILKGETAGAEGTITCHKDLIEGLILVPSMLVDKLLVKFHTNCEEVIPALKEEKKCTEPILTKPLMGTLGFLNKAAVPVGMLLQPETGSEFAKTECEGTNTTVGGELVGEYPETNPFTRAGQYNKDLTEYAFVLQASGTSQHWTTFELLNGFMEKVELKTEGFLGGKAAEEGAELLELPEAGLIET
jgi:hypothetical protein